MEKMFFIQFHSIEKMLVIQFHSIEKRLMMLFSYNFEGKETDKKSLKIISRLWKMLVVKFHGMKKTLILLFSYIHFYSMKLYERV